MIWEIKAKFKEIATTITVKLTGDIQFNSGGRFTLAVLSDTRVEARLRHTGQLQGEGHAEIVDFRIIIVGSDKNRIVSFPLELCLRVGVNYTREFDITP